MSRTRNAGTFTGTYMVVSRATTWTALANETADAVVEAIHDPAVIQQALLPHKVVVLTSTARPLTGTPVSPLSRMPRRLQGIRVEFHRIIDDARSQHEHEIHVYLRRP